MITRLQTFTQSHIFENVINVITIIYGFHLEAMQLLSEKHFFVQQIFYELFDVVRLRHSPFIIIVTAINWTVN